MGLADRSKLYREIEDHRKRPLVVYVTSKRQGVECKMSSDALPSLTDQLDLIPPDAEALDLLLAGYGGDPMVSWRIMSLIRERVKNVSVLIPQSAYSAATLLALGADEIVMHPNANLGPIDMQITAVSDGGPRHFSTEDVGAFLDFVRDRLGLTDQEHLRKLFEMMCKEVGTLGLGFTARSSKLAVALGEKLLGMHMTDVDQSNKKKALIESLSRQFHSHAYPVSRTEAMEIGLAVNQERDAKLEDLMWKLWLDIEKELQERYPFNPITELLNNHHSSAVLLSPVPQMYLPCNAPAPNHFQAGLKEVNEVANKKLDPVAFSAICAIIESVRLAQRFMLKGKILASRLPDLNIQFNCLPKSHCWEVYEVGT
ncbi:MAG: hypothetical protein K8R46_05105 [Pirellulales bacterium]|nr:hypothetical protein [Pirellulales bacterium]